MLKRVFACLLLISIAASPVLSGQQPNYLGITFLTTNDLHANLLPFNVDPVFKGKIPEIENVGGAARRATIIRKERSEARYPVMLVDSGDTTYGTNPLAKAYHGRPDVEVLNAIGYEVLAPGNHDFQWPAADSLRNIKESRFPWVCANLTYIKTGKLVLPPYVIREVNGVKIAFFGLITITPRFNDGNHYKAARELELRSVDPTETAAKLVPELRQKADIVVLLSHLGAKIDAELAQKVPGIDLILGGHSHTRIPEPRLAVTGEPTAFSLGGVPVVQARCHGSEMGKTRVIFRRDPNTDRYTLMSCKGELISIDKTIPEDPEIARIIKRYESRLEKTPEPPKAK